MRHFNFLFSVLLCTALLFAVPAAAAQVPTGNAAPAGPDSSEAVTYYGDYNMEMIYQSGGTSMGVDVVGSYAHLAIGQRQAVVNISNPAKPLLVGQTDMLLGLALDVVVAGNYAYRAEPGVSSGSSFSGGALNVIDISNPAQPQEAVFHQIYGSSLREIALRGSYAYLADYSGGLQIVDIHDPLNPSYAAEVDYNNAPPYNFFPTDLALADGPAGSGKVYAYLISRNLLYIVDVTDPLHPAKAGGLDGGSEYFDDVAARNGYVYLASEDNLWVVNASNPAGPQHVNNMPLGQYYFDNLAVEGNYVYAEGLAGLYRFDMTDPASPNQVIMAGFARGFDIRLVSAGGKLAAYQALPGGLKISDITNPAAPVALGSYSPQFGSPDGVLREGKTLYVTDGDELGTRILNIGDPQHPQEIGRLNSAWGEPRAISGSMAYLVAPDRWLNDVKTEGSLQIVDVSNPAVPVAHGNYLSPGNPKDVAVLGSLAYLADGNAGLKILNVANPNNISVTGVYTTTGADRVKVAVVGSAPAKTYAYTAGSDGLVVIDVTDPAAPQKLGALAPDGNSLREIAIAQITPDGHVLIAGIGTGSSKTLYLIDATAPTAPAKAASASLTDYGYGLAVQGDHIYAAARLAGARSYKFTTTTLSFDGSFRLPTEVYDVAVDGNFIFSAAAYSGLFASWFGPSTSVVVPTTGSMTLTSSFDGSQVVLASNTFTTTVEVIYKPRFCGGLPGSPFATKVGPCFELRAWEEVSLSYLQPQKAYTLTVPYAEGSLGEVNEQTLGLYYWNGSQWVKEPTAVLDTAANQITAHPTHFSEWAVMGAGSSERLTFLPVVTRAK